MEERDEAYTAQYARVAGDVERLGIYPASEPAPEVEQEKTAVEWQEGTVSIATHYRGRGGRAVRSAVALFVGELDAIAAAWTAARPVEVARARLAYAEAEMERAGRAERDAWETYFNAERQSDRSREAHRAWLDELAREQDAISAFEDAQRALLALTA